MLLILQHSSLGLLHPALQSITAKWEKIASQRLQKEKKKKKKTGWLAGWLTQSVLILAASIA